MLARFGVSIEPELLEKFDRLIAERGYKNRSEAIRDLIRERLVQQEWEKGIEETVGTVTIVYDHHVRELTTMLTELQHQHHNSILATLHIHLDTHHCLEVLAIRGKPDAIRQVAHRLISLRGVKHGKLVMTSTGTHL